MAHGGVNVGNTLITNGATLEDCHSNVFVLTELTGLKWCRYSSGHSEVEVCTDVCEDPILKAYSKCLKEDLLCVWRRIPVNSTSATSSHLVLHQSSTAAASSNKIDLRLAAEKELWVFWYGEEQPTVLKTICASLTRLEEASWDKGVEYETRSLLFKALHNLIERSLLQRDYVRLGNWFVQPLCPDEISNTPKYLLAFSFSFFVHGENNVCVSITVQRQPPVCRLSRSHLVKRENGITQKILLAPFCIAGTLSRQCHVNFDSDHQACKLWKEWSEFYPLPELDNTENMGYVDLAEKERQDQLRALAPPRMVEVVVSGVRLKYPTAYILVECAGTTDGKAGTANNDRSEQSSSSKVWDNFAAAESDRAFSGTVLQRAAEEVACAVPNVFGRRPSQPGNSTPTCESQQEQQDEAAVSWEYVDTWQKESCGCTAPPKSTPSQLKFLNKAQLKFGCTTNPTTAAGSATTAGSGIQRHHRLLERQNRLGKSGPFHRRQAINSSIHASSINPPMPAIAGTSSSVGTPAMDSQQPLEFDTEHNRPLVTPVTPAAIVSSAASSSCPVLPSTLSSSAPDIPVASLASRAKAVQQPSLNNVYTIASSSSTVVLKASPDHAVIAGFGRHKRRLDSTGTTRRLWKRPRLNVPVAEGEMAHGTLSISLGLNGTLDKNVPSSPPYVGISSPDWCIKKTQKYKLTSTKPFTTPPGALLSRDGDNYYSSMSSLPKMLSRDIGKHFTISSEMSTANWDINSGINSGGGAAMRSTSPSMATTNSVSGVSSNKANVGLPENIMDDSPTMPNEFLSPPPSHPHEEENATQQTASRQAFSNHNATNVIHPTNLTAAVAAKSQYDMIYPTPPSIEAPTMYVVGQFSPEASAVVIPAMAHRSLSPIQQIGQQKSLTLNDHSAILVSDSAYNYNSPVYGVNSYSTSDHLYKTPYSFVNFTDNKRDMPLVAENRRTAKYLLADTYSPKSLANRQVSKMKNELTLQFWKKSDQRQSHFRNKSSMGTALVRPSSPFFHYSSPGQQSQSGPGSPIAALPPPPPYGLQKIWPSPAAVGSPFGIRIGGPKTPASVGYVYDIQSPVSNASSLYARNDASVEAATTIGHTPGSAISTGEGMLTPEGHSLVLSLLMCDTVADLYRDTSFDSCPLCVCSMGIMGVDAGIYVVVSKAAVAAAASRQLSNSLLSTWKCTCGFSAVRYRNLSWKAGLFFEDEYEATGFWPSPNDSSSDQQLRLNRNTAMEFITLIRYSALICDDLMTDNRLQSSILATYSGDVRNSNAISINYVRPIIELRDLAEMCNQAVEQACLMMDCTKPSRDDFHASSGGIVSRSLIAEWGYMKATQQSTNSEACFVLRTLSPILQEAMQKSRNSGSWQTSKQQHGTTVEGPLSWRQLHRKCLNRTTNDWSGPEPIPLLLLATDRDWITVSPFALRSWDRLSLEPFGHQKDVAYIALVPDNQVVMSKARQFFRALGKMYEALRLGRHCPITRALKDGIMAVKKDYATARRTPVHSDSAFDNLVEQNPKLGAKLKLYAQVCRYSLAPHLIAENVFDKSIFRDVGKEGSISTGSTSGDGSSVMPPPSTFPTKESQDQTGPSNATSSDNDGDNNEFDSSCIPHTVVIYVVDAFSFGGNDREDPKSNHLAAVALNRCYQELLHDLPDSTKPYVQMEIVPLQAIFETSFSEIDTGCSQPDYLRRLAFSIFQRPRYIDFNCITSTVAKPLTGFGTAASRLELIRRKTRQQTENSGFGDYYRAYCPQVVLAPTFEKSAIALNSDSREDTCRVLFISYCLSERQEWLLATATDHQGCMMEDCVIDMRVINRRCVTRRPVSSSGNRQVDQGPEGSVIWETLRKLWSFVTSLLATGTHPWRLVIGRLGRLGHEELKAWAHFLCRSKLRMTTRLIRERCGMCSTMPSFYETTTILSACLISTEPDPSLRIFPNSFSHDDRFGQGGKYCPLSTPEDVSCTHVMVFPTSATIHMTQSAIPGSISAGPDGDTDDLDFLDLNVEMQDFGEFGDVFGGDGTFGDDSGRPFHQQPALAETADESIQLQPLALGYLVSTASSGWLPDWFWTNRPSGQSELPVHLRSSLHIHTSGVQQSDEQLLQTTSNSATAGGGFANSGSRNAAHSHPLDSSLTTDVLRYVLETYNSLSWLTFDTRTGDRRSCMPVHIQYLCRLYKSMDGFDVGSMN